MRQSATRLTLLYVTSEQEVDCRTPVRWSDTEECWLGRLVCLRTRDGVANGTREPPQRPRDARHRAAGLLRLGIAAVASAHDLAVRGHVV